MDINRKLAEINQKAFKTIVENRTVITDSDDKIREIIREELLNTLPIILEEFYRDKLVLERTGQSDQMVLKVGDSIFRGKMELLR